MIVTDPNPGPPSRTSALEQELIRYTAPEQIAPERFGRGRGDPPTKESDIYSLAMTAYEVSFPALPLGTAEIFPSLSGPHGDQTILQGEK